MASNASLTLSPSSRITVLALNHARKAEGSFQRTLPLPRLRVSEGFSPNRFVYSIAKRPR